MKIAQWIKIRPLAGVAFVALLALLTGEPPARAQTIPGDARVTCPVTPQKFATWFQSGAPSLNGVVNPANSLGFSNTSNCSFYEWAMQMFLWATSPAPSTIGGGKIFASKPPFFEVSPPDSSGNRRFSVQGVPPSFSVPIGFSGPHGLPVVFSKSRQMLEVERALVGPHGKPLIRDRGGQPVEITRIEKEGDGKAIFFNLAGVKIPGAAPSFRKVVAPGNSPSQIVQKFTIGQQAVFVDLLGNVVDVEQGESDFSVLMSRGCSLVYYGIDVNDVYAYFLTAVKDGAIAAGTPFPTTAASLAPITAFASSHAGVTFPDANALAVVVKTAWVEASALPNPGEYVTMMATVPAYSPDGTGPCQNPPSNPTTMQANGQKTVQLALVGMHVVGSAAGHPEMIWATFEHVGNTPNEQYAYFNANGQETLVPRDTSSTAWLFSAANAAAPFNLQRMQYDPSTGNIVATGNNTIGPSNTLRSKPWGGAFDTAPNPVAQPFNAGSSAASNTEILSINNSIRQNMPANDVRAKYLLIGATWTAGGQPPVFGGNPLSPSFPNGPAVGTSKMTNSLLETYFQGDMHFRTGLSCFDCHSSGSSLNPADPDGLSHIFSVLAPFF